MNAVINHVIFNEYKAVSDMIHDDLMNTDSNVIQNTPGITTRVGISNYPNPFNPSTTITYSLPKNMQINLDIYNLKGQKVKTLQSGKQSIGKHSVIWKGTDDNGRPVASGMYFYKLIMPDKVLTNKMVMLK